MLTFAPCAGLQPMASSVGLPNRQEPEPAEQLDPTVTMQEGGAENFPEAIPSEVPR